MRGGEFRLGSASGRFPRPPEQPDGAPFGGGGASNRGRMGVGWPMACRDPCSAGRQPQSGCRLGERSGRSPAPRGDLPGVARLPSIAAGPRSPTSSCFVRRRWRSAPELSSEAEVTGMPDSTLRHTQRCLRRSSNVSTVSSRRADRLQVRRVGLPRRAGAPRRQGSVRPRTDGLRVRRRDPPAR